MSIGQASASGDGEKELEPDQRERLFAHGMHEENVFYNRLNIFLVCESLLFAAAYSGLSGEHRPAKSMVGLICGVGLVLSLLWLYVQNNKLILLKTLEARFEGVFPEFRVTIAEARRRKRWKFQEWSASRLLAYSFPAMFMIAWGVMLWHLFQSGVPARVGP